MIPLFLSYGASKRAAPRVRGLAVLLTLSAVLLIRWLYAAWPILSTNVPALCLLVGAVTVAYFGDPGVTGLLLAGFAPLLTGLHHAGLLRGPDPLILLLSAAMIIHALRALPSRPGSQAPRSKAVWAIMFALLLLALANLFSLAITVGKSPPDADFFDFLQHETVVGFGSRYYPWTAALTWSLGFLFAFNLIAHGHEIRRALRPALILAVAAIGGFALLQWGWDLPPGYALAGGHRALTTPYEDIHSLGAIAVSLMIGLAAALPHRPSWTVAGCILACLVLAAVTLACWSRATWLAEAVGLTAVGLLRLPRRWRGGFLAAGALALITAGYLAHTQNGGRNIYLSRLDSLLRIEDPAKKDPTRIALYHKALRMIAERPLTGHGIGSFYRQAPRFAEAADPYGQQPDFAHDFLLQFAAEMGLPALFLLLAIIGAALWRGGCLSLAALRDRDSNLTVFGITMALLTYLLTQLTANALNIYVSNQVFFWPLVALLVTWPRIPMATANAQDSRA